MSLDIKGAFDKNLMHGVDCLIIYSSYIGVRQKPFSLMASYLSDRYLFVISGK